MKVFVWLLRGLVFLALLILAVKNSDPVNVRFVFGALWPLPLNFLMLAFFAAGAAVGVTAALATVVRQRREIAELRARERAAESMAGAPGRPHGS